MLALFCAGLILFGLWGCSGRMDNREDTKTNRLDLPPEHLELSERQREILKKENLPQEYDKLTQTQKRAICRMEKMLCYLDENTPAWSSAIWSIRRAILIPSGCPCTLAAVPPAGTSLRCARRVITKMERLRIIISEYMCVLIMRKQLRNM